MNKPLRGERTQTGEELRQTINTKETRKLSAREDRADHTWFGLGMFGLVGWSVAVPTVLGIAVGIWIDSKWPGQISWTLTFLGAGLLVGCLMAWSWVKKESRGS